jgi:hypothetical protein
VYHDLSVGWTDAHHGENDGDDEDVAHLTTSDEC